MRAADFAEPLACDDAYHAFLTLCPEPCLRRSSLFHTDPSPVVTTSILSQVHRTLAEYFLHQMQPDDALDHFSELMACTTDEVTMSVLSYSLSSSRARFCFPFPVLFNTSRCPICFVCFFHILFDFCLISVWWSFGFTGFSRISVQLAFISVGLR